MTKKKRVYKRNRNMRYQRTNQQEKKKNSGDGKATNTPIQRKADPEENKELKENSL